MPYCATADFVVRFGEDELIQLTDRLGVGAVDRAVFDRAAEDVAAEIDGYLAARYALPLSGQSALLVSLSCDMVRWRLAPDAVLEQVRQRYEDARRLLEGVAAGRARLDLPPAAAPAAGAQLCEAAAGRRVFRGELV